MGLVRAVVAVNVLFAFVACENQNVVELKKTVAALQDIKNYLRDIVTLEERMLALLNTKTEPLIPDPQPKTGRSRAEKRESIRGRQGETVTLRCRNRPNISWSLEPLGREGEVEAIQDVSRKLRILVGPDTLGTYRCFTGSQLMHSFELSMDTKEKKSEYYFQE